MTSRVRLCHGLGVGRAFHHQRRSSDASWFAAQALALGLVMAPPAYAQTPGEEIARHAFEDGVTLEKRADYAGALAKFRASMEVKPTLGNRFHIAFCLEMTNKLSAALTEYEIVDKTAREQNKSDVIEATRVRIEPLRAKVPQLGLKLSSRTANAEVELDGKAVPAVLLDGRSFRVDPGEHTVSARAAHHDPFTKTFTSNEGDTTTLDIALEPSPPERSTTERVSVARRDVQTAPRRGPRSAAIITTAGAIVLAGGGVAAFLVAGRTSSDAEDDCRTRLSCAGERDKVRTFDALALSAWIGAAGVGALAVVLWTSRAPVATSVALAARPSWLGLEGRFF